MSKPTCTACGAASIVLADTGLCPECDTDLNRGRRGRLHLAIELLALHAAETHNTHLCRECYFHCQTCEALVVVHEHGADGQFADKVAHAVKSLRRDVAA